LLQYLSGDLHHFWVLADPSELEKAALVRMTGVSLSRVNNWLSNARVRIWRPAVESLDC
jgi:hypothetical protein